jgi:hypothetical protein
MAKVVEQAQADLTEAISNFGGASLQEIADFMYVRGWVTVTPANIIATARDINFTVIGETIYGLDD